MVLLEHKINIQNIQNVGYIYLILCGFLMSIGVVVPGVSNTIILMLLGVYSLYLTSVSNIYLPVLIPMGIGLVLGSIIFMKIIKCLLEKYYTKTILIIIGFTVGSIPVLFPEINSIIELIISVLSIFLGYCGIIMLK